MLLKYCNKSYNQLVICVKHFCICVIQFFNFQSTVNLLKKALFYTLCLQKLPDIVNVKIHPQIHPIRMDFINNGRKHNNKGWEIQYCKTWLKTSFKLKCFFLCYNPVLDNSYIVYTVVTTGPLSKLLQLAS